VSYSRSRSLGNHLVRRRCRCWLCCYNCYCCFCCL